MGMLIGPLTVIHDHARGRSTIDAQQRTVESVMLVAVDNQTAPQVAMMVYENANRNTIERTVAGSKR